KDGAMGVCRNLCHALPDRDIKWALPGDGAKDARDWLSRVRPGDGLETWELAGEWFTANLVPGVEEDQGTPGDGNQGDHHEDHPGDHRGESQGNLPQEAEVLEGARLAQAHLEELVDKLREEKLPRAPGCGSCRATLVRLDTGGPLGGKGVSGHFRCRRLE